MPAKKTARSAAAPRSPRATARPAAAKTPRAKRVTPAAPARVPAIAAPTANETVSPKAPAAASPSATLQRPVTREDIQVRAYFLALENAGQGGSLDYWLAAERELLQGAASRD
ncbi:MAG: DUF2934 domain-containing protein [Vicinamibacterales bacterium]